jgi:hypothetical protein
VETGVIDASLRVWAARAGILGPIALALYFAAPAALGWPYAGGAPATIAAFAQSHEPLFYAGAWLQVTGTLLSVVFFLALVRLAAQGGSVAGLVVVVGSAALLSVVLVEAAFLVAVPLAATAGDAATVATAFAMSNGVFVRVFPLAPASATLIALGLVLRAGDLLDRRVATAAIALGVLFEVAGLVAIVSTAGLVAVILLSVGQAIWTLVAAIALLRDRGSAGQAG